MTHVKNAEVFARLVDSCTGYGGKYNPGRPTLQINALLDQKAKASTALSGVISAKSDYDNQVNQRKQLFDQLPKLAASVMRTLEASGASPETLEDARAFVHQITGFTKQGAATPPPAQAATTPATPSLKAKSHSQLQMSYASKADSFAKLLNAVSNEPLYLTNETELGIAGLTDKLDELNAANAQVSTARVAWSNARVIRNNVMYNETQSMHKTARAVKKYVRAIFGHGSDQYAQVKNLSFTKPNS